MATLPPWLNVNPTSGAPLFLEGFGMGQRGAALNLERDRQDQLAAQHAQDVAAETELQKERIASTLASDLLDRQVKAQTATKQLQGMQKYQSLVASGMDPSQALIHAAPDMFYQHPEHLTTALHQNEVAKGLAAARASTAAHQGTMEDFRRREVELKENPPSRPKLFHVGNSLIRVNPDGTQETLFTSNDPSKLDQWEHSELTAELNRSWRDFGAESDQYKHAKSELDKFKKRFKKRIGTPRSTAAPESEALPMPKTKIELQVGKTYRTLRGDAMWDGEHFVK